jgi:hypothetical protein
MDEKENVKNSINNKTNNNKEKQPEVIQKSPIATKGVREKIKNKK